MFHKKGIITVDKKAVDEDKVIELALEAGADDVNADGDSYEIVTPPALGPRAGVLGALALAETA